MLSINTNLSSLMLQASILNATLGLNDSIEHLTTGFKVNHAKDNAANFGIITNMTTGIGSLEIAEDNAAMALDMLSTASSNLDLISSHLSRLRDLANISANGTYGQDSRDALQAELNSRLGEISRVLESGEYNNKTLFEENNGTQGISTYSSNDMSSTVVMTADKDTTFEDLGITDRVINLYNKSGSLTNTFTFDSLDTIGKFLDILEASGFSTKISNGIISVESSSGAYIDGGLADALGIETETSTVITSATSSSTLKVSYTETTTADAATTFAEVGLDMQGKTLDINSKDTNQKIATITIDSNSKTFDDLFNALEPYGIDGTINNGRITLNSDSYYVTGEIANLLGIGTSSESSTETAGSSVTSDSVIVYTSSVVADTTSRISDFITLDSNNKILLHNGSQTTTFTVTNTTTFGDMLSAFASAGINSSMNDGRISFSSSGGSYAEDLNPSGGVLQKLGITTTTISNTQTTSGISQTSSNTLYCTIESSLTENAYITSAIELTSANNILIINNGNSTEGTITITNTMTFADLKSKLAAYNIGMSIDSNGSIILNDTSSSGKYVSGSFADAIGLSTITTIQPANTTAVLMTGSPIVDDIKYHGCDVRGESIDYFSNKTISSSLITYTKDGILYTLNESTTFADLGADVGNGWEYITALGYQYCAFTIYNDTTIAEYCSLLTANGINAYINNGSIILESTDGYHALFGAMEKNNDIFKFPLNRFGNLGVDELIVIDNADIELYKLDTIFFRYMPQREKRFEIEVGDEDYRSSSHYTFTVNTTTTLNDLLEAFNSYGVEAKFVNGRIEIEGGEKFIYDIRDLDYTRPIQEIDMRDIIGLKYSKSYYTSTVLAQGTDEIIIYKDEISLMSNGKEITGEYFTGSDSYTYITINDFVDKLGELGINANFSEGKFRINGDNEHYIEYIDSGLANRLGLGGYANGKSYTIIPERTITTNSDSDVLTIESSQMISTTTKLSELGFNIGAFELLEVNSNKNLYFTVNSTSTVGDIIEAINKQAGLNASLTNGMLTVAGSSSAYITDMNADFASIFKLAGAGDGKTYVSTGVVVQGNSDSDAQKTNVTQTAASGTTLGELGLTSNGVIKINDKNTGAKTINVNADTTIQELQNKLNGITVSFANGRLTLAGSDSVWITSISQNLIDALNLPGAGKDITYTTTSSTDYTNTPSNKTLQTQSTSTLAGDTKLSEITGYANGNGKIALHRDDGTYVTLSLSATDTIQNFFNKIKTYGINASITDGKVTFESAGDIYLESISGGSNILSVLNIGNIQKVKETVTSNNESNKLTYNKVIQSDWRNYNFDTTFGVVGGNPNDTITLGFDFNLNFGLDISTQETAKSAIEDLDRMLEQISLAQTHLGAAENRFTSILEDISIRYENLVSSRSTLRDADIAEESSEYIKMQILQQASATLLATANQSPSIALQLL